MTDLDYYESLKSQLLQLIPKRSRSSTKEKIQTNDSTDLEDVDIALDEVPESWFFWQKNPQ